MFPTLIDLGVRDLPLLGETHVFLPSYGLIFAVAVLVAWWWFMRRARAIGLDEDRAFNLTFYTLIGGIVGAKLLLVLLDWRVYLADPAEILGTLRSAGVLVGGVIAGALTFAFYATRKGLPLWTLADAIAAPLALAQGIGRFGCFGAGCCWGATTSPDNPLAVTFTNPLAGAQTGVPLNLPLIPTQVIQMTHDVGLAIVLTLLWRRRPLPAGTVFWVYVLIYSIGRGIIELWRGDAHRGLHFGGLASTSQLFSIAGGVLALAMLVRGRLARRQTASA